MNRAFDHNLTLLIIGLAVPLWCVAIVAFAAIKASNSKASTLFAVTIAFGDALAFFGVRIRRREGGGTKPFDATFAGRDGVVGK